MELKDTDVPGLDPDKAAEFKKKEEELLKARRKERKRHKKRVENKSSDRIREQMEAQGVDYNPPIPPADKDLPDTQKLNNILQRRFKFDLIKEIIKTYKETNKIQDDLLRLRMKRSIQQDLLKYCYPVMKATSEEIEKPGIVFNLNVPDELKNITPIYVPPPAGELLTQDEDWGVEPEEEPDGD